MMMSVLCTFERSVYPNVVPRECKSNVKWQVCVSAAYWLVNRTGLPLVFRAEGGAQEAAGQFPEHELARMVAPLLFAFADSDAAPTLQARLGRALPGLPEVPLLARLPGLVHTLLVKPFICNHSMATETSLRF